MAEDTQVLEGFKNLLDRYDKDSTALAQKLYDENYNYRQKNKALIAEVDALKEQAIGEDQVAISSSDASALNEYRELGTPEEIKTSLVTLSEKEERLTSLQREAKLAKVSTDYGFNPKVLATLTNGNEIVIAEDGKATIEDVELRAYAEANWPDFMSSLVAEPVGTRFPEQTGVSGKNKTKDEETQELVDSYLGNTYLVPGAN